MELEPLQLLTTILKQYSVSEPLRQGESKINASIDFSNQIAEQMNKHTKWLQFVGDEVIRKIATRPYFFNILDDMLHCDYLTSNTCCFVLGTDSPTDGRMKLFYIVDTLPDGKEVDSINVYQLDSGLYALYTTEETITTLRELILQNSQEIDSLKEMVETGGNSYTPDNPPPYPVTTVAGKTGAVVLNKSDVGLASVDNVRQYSSSNPPPYPVTSVAGRTGAVTLSKSDVGLGNVSNTSDANKPISTATQNALNLKAPLASPAFTGNATLTGNLTLKGSGNYGNKINFGDGDYVHIAEPSDDTLEIKGTRVNLLGEVKINGRVPAKKGATVVVGNTSAGHTKEDCDFLCTGTNDDVTIQKAIDSIKGGTIYLLEGEYNLYNSITVPNQKHLTGTGDGTVIYFKEGDYSNKTMIKGSTSYPRSNRISNLCIAVYVYITVNTGTHYIENFRMVDHIAIHQENGIGISFCDMVSRCRIERGGYAGIYCCNAIENYVSAGSGMGIYQNSSSYYLTIGNIIYGINSSYGIYLNDAGQICIGNRLYVPVTQPFVRSIYVGGSYSGVVVLGNCIDQTAISSVNSNAVIVNNVVKS